MDQKSKKTPPDRTPIRRWAKLRLWVGYAYLLSAVIFARPQMILAIVGVALVLAGAIIRLISSATLVKDRELCTNGIYSATRNPLYLGSALAALGFAAMTTSIWFIAAFILILLPLYMRMIALEEKYLGELYPKSYPAYMKTVPRFLPRLWLSVRISGTLDWKRLLRSKEITTAILFVLLSAILLIWHRSWLPN